jgi:hypothetical protein
MRDVSGWQGSGSHLNVKFAAAPSHYSLVLEAQTQTAKCDFEPGRVFIIANQQIRHAQRKWIQCAAG